MAVTLTNELEAAVAVIQFARGDLLVVRVPDQLTAQHAQQLHDLIQARVPDGVEVLVVDAAVELELYRRPPATPTTQTPE
jgi:hypothetical protein